MSRWPHLQLVAAADPAQVLRFAFAPGINAEAQAVLARLFDAFATSLDGVDQCRTRFDEERREWVATLEGTGALAIRDEGAYPDGRQEEQRA